MLEYELSPQEVARRHAEGVRLVDVRPDDERSEARIPGDEQVELAELTARAAELADGPVIFYCRSGARSGMAADAFRASGLEAYNLSGGILAWADAGLPLEPDGAVPT